MTATIHLQATDRKTIDIGNGLIMRWSTSADAANVASLVAEAFKWMSVNGPIPDGVTPGPNDLLSAAASRLLSGKNCTMSEFDYALVEDTTVQTGKNPIVACVSLHRLKAYYGSVDLFFGNPELIATQAEYRNRGLVRKLLLNMIHPESEARGDALQFIYGIPHFYRQFGYEYAMSSYPLGTIHNIDSIPALIKGKTEPFRLRKATAEDIPRLVSMSAKERVSPKTELGLYYSAEYWQYTVHDIFEIAQSKYDGDRDTMIVVDTATGKDVGFTIVSHVFGVQLEAFSLDQDVLWTEALYPVLRQLVAIEKRRLLAKKQNEGEGSKIDTSGFPFKLAFHPQHPAALLLGSRMTPGSDASAVRLYTRIPNYTKFIRLVTPELEKRLANSPMAGVTGRLRLDFYRKVEGSEHKGLEIVFKNGLIEGASAWAKLVPEKDLEEYLEWKARDSVPVIYGAAFAPLTFTILLMGERSLEEIQFSFAETRVKDDDSRLLLNILFPKISHHVETFYW
ncbi:hypothetical protein EC968_005601 [Mortierella alpina]|nr:hypothetical protein EC968_005601 [Mortierella alpina]